MGRKITKTSSSISAYEHTLRNIRQINRDYEIEIENILGCKLGLIVADPDPVWKAFYHIYFSGSLKLFMLIIFQIFGEYLKIKKFQE